jgi:hypothetical protein
LKYTHDEGGPTVKEFTYLAIYFPRCEAECDQRPRR